MPKLAAAPPGSPIVVAGMFRAASGLGEAARSTYRSLSAVGLNPIAVDVTAALTLVDVDTDIPLSAFPANRVGTLILQVNPPEIALAMRHLQLPDQGQWRIVGYWAWELPTFPAGWDLAFDMVNEVWTLSEFSARALMSHPRAPIVRWAPIAVSVPEGIHEDRARFGIRDSVFAAITMADARSSFTRKNPIGAIKAFQLAFGESQDCELIVKTQNLDHSRGARLAIENAIANATNIRLIDASLSNLDRWELLASVDTLISLHRAEGFGLGPAEAMALGKPVVATGWSGNMSYMTPQTAQLIGYRLTRVEDEFELYGRQNDPGLWAEPDLEEAANVLRRIRGMPTYGREVGLAARKKISEELSPMTVGQTLGNLLRNSLRSGLS